MIIVFIVLIIAIFCFINYSSREKAKRSSIDRIATIRESFPDELHNTAEHFEPILEANYQDELNKLNVIEEDSNISSYQTCPFCLSNIPRQVQKCKHCGEWISNPISKSEIIPILHPNTNSHNLINTIANKYNINDIDKQKYCLLAPIVITSLFLIIALVVMINHLNGGEDLIGWLLLCCILAFVEIIAIYSFKKRKPIIFAIQILIFLPFLLLFIGVLNDSIHNDEPWLRAFLMSALTTIYIIYNFLAFRNFKTIKN